MTRDKTLRLSTIRFNALINHTKESYDAVPIFLIIV